MGLLAPPLPISSMFRSLRERDDDYGVPMIRIRKSSSNVQSLFGKRALTKRPLLEKNPLFKGSFGKEPLFLRALFKRGPDISASIQIAATPYVWTRKEGVLTPPLPPPTHPPTRSHAHTNAHACTHAHTRTHTRRRRMARAIYCVATVWFHFKLGAL